jgi:hypothetical protein
MEKSNGRGAWKGKQRRREDGGMEEETKEEWRMEKWKRGNRRKYIVKSYIRL